MTTRFAAVLFSLALAAPFMVKSAQQAPAAEAVGTVINALTFRNIGPFRTAAWVTDSAVPDSPARDHLYIVTLSLQSTNSFRTSFVFLIAE